MEMEELAAKIQMMEQAQAMQSATQMKDNFIDKYGTKFSGDEGIGVAVLAELGRRGIDVSAADEAVQEILDGIRQEATSILDKIKSDERAVSDLMDKVSTIEDGVAAATGAQPETSPDIAGSAPPAEAMPPGDGLAPEGGLGGELPMGDIGGGDPMAGDMAGDMGADPMASDMSGGMPPPDMGAPPPDMGGAPPPDMVPSDARIKRVNGLKARVSTLRANRQVVSDARVKRVPAHLLDAVRSI